MSDGAPAARPLQFVPTLPPEEVARANFYGLLARLFYAPPDAALLEALAGAGDLEAEERSGPVDTSNLVPTRAGKDSRMMKLPGEVLQRYV